jgi:hypothetical protein
LRGMDHGNHVALLAKLGDFNLKAFRVCRVKLIRSINISSDLKVHLVNLIVKLNSWALHGESVWQMNYTGGG